MVSFAMISAQLRLEAPFAASAHVLAYPAGVHEHDQQHVQQHEHERDPEHGLREPRDGSAEKSVPSYRKGR